MGDRTKLMQRHGDNDSPARGGVQGASDHNQPEVWMEPRRIPRAELSKLEESCPAWCQSGQHRWQDEALWEEDAWSHERRFGHPRTLLTVFAIIDSSGHLVRIECWAPIDDEPQTNLGPLEASDLFEDMAQAYEEARNFVVDDLLEMPTTRVGDPSRQRPRWRFP